MLNTLLQVGSNGQPYYEWLLSGTAWTLGLAICGWFFAFLIGILVGIGRVSKSFPYKLLARLYVEIFRNIPVLVQMFLWYFVLPQVLPTPAGNWIKHIAPPWGEFIPALICLSLYTAARVAEQVKAGLESLPKGQGEAAAALSLSSSATFRFILLPQAIRLIIPSLTSEVMGIYKNTSVALTIGVMELTAQAKAISDETFKTFTAFGAATIIYLILALLAYKGMSWLDHAIQIPGSAPTPKPSLKRGFLRRLRGAI